MFIIAFKNAIKLKKLLFPLLIAIIGLSACKSNNNNASPAPGYWGQMDVTIRTADSNFAFPIYDELASAQFYTAPNAYFTKVLVTGISVNGFNISDNGDSQYVDQPGPGIETHALWAVNGANGVPSFTYDDVGAFPRYTGPKPPDTIVRANGFTLNIPLTSIQGGETARIVLNEYGLYQSKERDPAGNISFTAQELSSLQPGLNYMNLVISKTNPQTFSGKQYIFVKERVYMSYVWVK